MSRNETHHVTLDIDWVKLSNAIADALRLERERVRQGREDPIRETNPKPWTYGDALRADVAAAAARARTDALLADIDAEKARRRANTVCPARPDGHHLQFTYVLAAGGYPTGVKCATCGDTWPIPPRGPRPRRLLEQLEQMRVDLAAQYERLAGDPVRQSGYYVAVQLLNDIINNAPTE